MAKERDKNFIGVRLTCTECKKPISRKASAYVLMGTYNRPSKPNHEAFYHFPCFVDWYNEKVREKAFGLASDQTQIMNMINDPKLKKLASNILGEISFSPLLNKKQEEKPMVAKKKSTSKKPQVKRGKNEKTKANTKRRKN